ncbi:DMT family transporter [Methanooceanicella nereidis]|uniref:DMT family transporter n=1 Tax=Methanooceanicella nereidis TaxID=2052831 RepID=UPI001E3D8493
MFQVQKVSYKTLLSLDEIAFTKVMLVLAMVIWGGSFIASKVGLSELYPIELAALRFAIATPVLLLFTVMAYGVGSLKIDLKDLPVLIVLGMTGVTLQYIFQFIGMYYTTVTNSALLINMATFFIIIPSAIFLKEKINADNILGVILAFVGAALVITKGEFIFQANIIGDGLILICAVLWAIYVLTGNKLAGKYSVLTQLNYIFIIGFIGLIPAYFLTPHHALTEISLLSWECIIFLSIFCSIFAYFIINNAIVKIGPSKTAIYQYFEPLFAIIFAIILLSEPLTVFIGIGGLMIIAGIAMADNNIKLLSIFKNKA